MTTIIETTVYNFAELSDRAKEKARDWYSAGMDCQCISGLEDWTAVAKILGVEFDSKPVRLMGGGTRLEPCVYYSASHSQGASFAGRYHYAKGAPAAIRAYAPLDTTLHSFADRLQAAQRGAFYRLQATVSVGRFGGIYTHSGTMSVDVERSDGGEPTDRQSDELTQLLRCFADWIYKQVLAEIDYLYSDAVISETMADNKYTFTETGSRFG